MIIFYSVQLTSITHNMEALTTRLREVEDGKGTIPPQSTIWRDRVEPAKDGANKSYIKPCHVKHGKARDTNMFRIATVSGNININKFVFFNPFKQSKFSKSFKFYVYNFNDIFDGLIGYELLQNLNSLIDTA